VFLSGFAGGVSSRAGGVSILFGSNSYSHDGAAAVAGSVIFDNSSLAIAYNTFDRCSASLVSAFDKLSFQAHSIAGAVSVHFGPTTLSVQNASRSLLVPSPVQLSDSLVHIVSNSFSRCFASVALQSCLSVSSSSKGGAVSFEISPNIVAFNATVDILLHDSAFDQCFALLTCSSVDKAAITVAGGAVAFSTSSLISQSPIVVSSCSFSNFSVIGDFFVSSRNFSVSGGAVYINTFMPFHLRSCNFNSTNSSGVIFRSIVAPQGTGGGGALHLANSLLLNIQNCFFQFNASSLGGAIVVVDKDVPESRFPSRSVQISDSKFFSAGFMMLSLTSNHILPSSTLQLSNSLFTSSSLMTLPLVSIANPTSVLSSDSSVTCPLNSHVSVTNASDLLIMSCDSCPILSFSYSSSILNLDVIQRLQQSHTSLTSLSQCYTTGTSGCPFGVLSCTGTLKVTPGLWMFYKNTSEHDGSQLSFSPSSAVRCPAGFCGCSNMEKGSCKLTAPLDLYRYFDSRFDTALCNNNRTGVLCSHCISGFTATMNEKGCMPNTECRENLPWIWAVVLFSYLMYGLYITFSCLNSSSGIMSAVLFFAQISQFAIPRVATSASASSSLAPSNMANFDPLISSYNSVCLGVDMSTYRLVLMKLYGPLFVLVFALFWAWVLKRYQRTGKSLPLDRTISYFGTLANCLLLVFSSVAAAVFKLIQCTDVDGVGRVVYLDGARSCYYDGEWIVLLCVVIVLVIIPFVFAYLLLYSKLPISARYAICNAYTDNFFFWAAVTLSQRTLMSLVAAFTNNPSAGHCVLLVIAMFMTLLLIQCKPYKEVATYRIDLICHICLILQLLCAILADASDSVGVPLSAAGDDAAAHCVLSHVWSYFVFHRFLQALMKALWSLLSFSAPCSAFYPSSLVSCFSCFLNASKF
jgi:hypothetical protein